MRVRHIFRYCDTCKKTYESLPENFNACPTCGERIKGMIDEANSIGVWPPKSYIKALTAQGINVDKMMSQYGGIVDFNLTGNDKVVIKSLSHYRQLCKERGLIGECDMPDHARDLELDLSRRRVYIDMGR